MKEKLEMHRKVVEENDRKFRLWKRFNVAEQCLGFRPKDIYELEMYECNGYDTGILMYC